MELLIANICKRTVHAINQQNTALRIVLYIFLIGSILFASYFYLFIMYFSMADFTTSSSEILTGIVLSLVIFWLIVEVLYLIGKKIFHNQKPGGIADKEGSAYAVVSLISSILGFVPIFSILAIIFGIVYLRKKKFYYRVLAITGIVLGSIEIFILLFNTVILTWIVNMRL